MTAMIRNLGKMSSIGLLKPLSEYSKMVCDRLKDEAALKKARVHPFNILLALKTYERGRGDKGKLTWTADQSIVASLNKAFYLSFRVMYSCKVHMIMVNYLLLSCFVVFVCF